MTLATAAYARSDISAQEILGLDKRRHKRVRISLLGRYMLADGREFPCQSIDISAGGLALYAPVSGKVDDEIVVYLDHLGRLSGTIVRILDNGFAMQFNISKAKSDRIADTLTWLINREALGIPDERRHDRIVPRETTLNYRLSDGSEKKCEVFDISLSGAAFKSEFIPSLGTKIQIGNTHGDVVRHFNGGFAVEFNETQSRQDLSKTFGGFHL